MSPSTKMDSIKMVALVVMLSIRWGAEGTPLQDQQTEATEGRSGYNPPNYANNYAGNQGGGGYGGYQKHQPQYGNQGIQLVLDSTCKRYSCIPTTSPMAMCALVCSPDGRTPFCPILNCVSASGATCSDFKCNVQTYAQQPYY